MEDKIKLNDESIADVNGGRTYEGGPNLTYTAINYYFKSDKSHEMVQLIENELFGKASIDTARAAFTKVTLNLNYDYFRNIYIYGTGMGLNPYLSKS